MSKLKGEKNFSQSALTDYSKLLNESMKEEEKIGGYHRAEEVIVVDDRQ